MQELVNDRKRSDPKLAPCILLVWLFLIVGGVYQSCFVHCSIFFMFFPPDVKIFNA